MTVYECQLSIDDVRVLLKSLLIHKERWSGGDPSEQMHIDELIWDFRRMVLDELYDESED